MALATGIFTTNCTLPPEGINWVSNPNVRSTLTILWTSLLTIFLCTWTVQHLSIPPPNEPRLATVWRKVKWMMVVIIAPEFMVGKSCSDWVAAVASESCPAMQEHANKSNTRWTTTHAFYANMGGFLVHGVNCHPPLNMNECTCAVGVPPTTKAGSTRSLSAQTSTEPPAISTIPPPAGRNIGSTGPPSLTPQAGATPDPISTDVDVDGIAVPPAQFTVSNGLNTPTPQAGAALELSSTDVHMDTTAAPPAKITPLVDVKAVASLPAAAQDGESNGLSSRTPQAGAALELSSTDVDVDAAAVPPAQTTPVVDVKPVASALAASQDGESSGLVSPSPQAAGTLDPAAAEVDMEAAKRFPSVQIAAAADETTATSVLAADQDGESNELLTSPISQVGETLHPAATDADIETATYDTHVRVAPAADETTATSVNAACEDEDSTGLTSPTRQATEETLDPIATDDIEATKMVPSVQTTPATDEATQVTCEDEESKGLTSPVAHAEALLEPSMSLKEVDIEAARTTPSAKIHRLADGKPTTLGKRLKKLGNRLKKRILHRNDRNHIWAERPPENPMVPDKHRVRRNHFPFAANSAQLCVLLSSGIIGGLPSITEAQINDKSKEDVVIKMLALLQVLQLVVQLIVRQINDLPASQLEIAALSFCVCAFFAYLFWLGKPKDIRLPTDVYITRHLDYADNEQLISLNSIGYFKYALLNIGCAFPRPYIPNDFYNTESLLWPSAGFDSVFVLTGEDMGFAFGGLIFGAFHCLVWNFVFPTLLERTLWQISSAAISAGVPLFYIIWYIGPVFSTGPESGWPWIVRTLLLCAFFLLYTVCRLFIMVEAVRSLFFLPPDAFISTWSVNIPHFG